MDISNLAVVMGPNLLHRRKRGGPDSISRLAHEAWEAPIVIEVVRELLEHHQLLFTVSQLVQLSSFLRVALKCRFGLYLLKQFRL